ncbi:MAG: UDP-glucose 4-epimerase GalE [Candidatus Marinimicrobia bacterium]|jgi:UDP-glucose 4-epimerase|nr:UDP-glucose 4-epimerase GalE [Candidatus Neomarinimicrobiota bacterium]MBT3960825.1 UDP-glucose 4-epimerase GalE [Candidatus Neomarinimicrobiota bacterium]MBT4634972.1 UDP-glucose 4-epimerase GalE [Candidatus Neomarinimicrobiota bacterium]MBT6938319.1 UDP-glucose 4-epimerase GalE [Candidatus Neomarinimicrobiota bacterium]MBT7269967.1 UDP-glucose 4-epimerase GalE [Candidatus Neomarinimicrobiota bacterium]
MKNKQILITGGAGYIGSHVVLALCDSGYDVTVFDDLSLGFRSNVDDRANFVQGSTLDQAALKHVFSQHFDAVIHLAAFKAAGESMIHPQKYSTNNINGTVNLLNAMVEADVKHFIFSSTAAVYGFPKYLPVDENHPLKPINYYGYTKLFVEQLLDWHSNLKNISFAALRYFNAAGYDEKGRIPNKEKNPANLLPIVMEVASGMRDSMAVFGNDYSTHDGTGVRDYIHVTDLATAHVKALEYLMNSKKNLTVNLATGVGYSVLDVIKMAEKITGESIQYTLVARRPGDPDELIAMSAIAEQKLQWTPEHSNLETLLKTMWVLYSKEKLI